MAILPTPSTSTSIRSPGVSQTGASGRSRPPGRARGDHVTEPQRGEGGKKLDRPRDVEDHLAGAGRLHDLAVQRGRQPQVGHVDLVGGDDLGPIGMVPSKFLPGVHWVAARCHSRAVPSITTT